MIEQEVYFLVAPVRSGSTFVKLMLDHHPDISNPGEFDFLFDLISDSGELPDIDDYINWLKQNRIFKGKGLNIETETSVTDLITSFTNQLSIKSRLCLTIHRNFERIPLLFPNAKYIHLLRDPRDVARSCIGMGWGGHVFSTVDIWSNAELSWDNLSQTISDEQFIEIRYEEVLENVDIELEKICSFMNIPYNSSMLDYSNNTTYAKPDKSLSYQWKKKYSEREKELIEYKLGDYILDKGYVREYNDPKQPNVIELISLKFKNKIFKWNFSVKKYGFILYLQLLIVRRVNIDSWVSYVQKRIDIVDIKHLK